MLCNDFQYNGCNPERIIIYRDGVGDGDLDYVEKYEVKQLMMTFDRIGQNYKPQLSVIIVQKRINTRLFVRNVSIMLISYLLRCHETCGCVLMINLTINVSTIDKLTFLIFFFFFLESQSGLGEPRGGYRC